MAIMRTTTLKSKITKDFAMTMTLYCSVDVYLIVVLLYVSFEFYVFTSMLYLIVAKCFHQIEDSQSHQSRSNESPFAMISIHWEG